MWPRFKLTPAEEKMSAEKYYNHKTGRRGVLRKIYPGQLMLTQQQRFPIFTFQIARRCRVFGFTCSGDLAQFKIQMQDSSGEHYLVEPISVPSLMGGYAEIPPSPYAATAGSQGGFPPNVDDAANTLGWGYPTGVPLTYAPFIMEPNIVLDSNEVLTVKGSPMTDYAGFNYRIDIAFHVWEFPSFNNGPA